jgi:hypothetical protein
MQLDKCRKKSGERLAATGRRDQQSRAAGLRLAEQLQLMCARRPAAARKPAGKDLRQERRSLYAVEHGHGGAVAANGDTVRAATTSSPGTGCCFSVRVEVRSKRSGVKPAFRSAVRI